MSAEIARATINLPRPLHTDLREWAIDATRVLGRPVSFQDAVRAMLAAGISDPDAGQAAMNELRDEMAADRYLAGRQGSTSD